VKGPTEERDGEMTEERGDELLIWPQRCALLTISGLLCGIQWRFQEGICETILEEDVIARMCNASGPERS